MEPPSSDWKCNRFAPQWASMFLNPTPRPPASHKCLERPNPERNSTAAAAVPCPRSWGHYPNSKKPSTSCPAACSSSEHCAAVEVQSLPWQGGYGVDSVRCGLSHNSLMLCSQKSRNSFSIFMMGGKESGVELGSVTNIQP